MSNFPRNYLVFILGGALFTVIIFMYAEWVGDNDLWWHMKYGEYMLQHATLRPDHSVFSWTDVDRDWIYVSWLPDIAYYVMFQFGGLPLLFIFRYLCVIAVAVITVSYGVRTLGREAVPISLGIAMLIISQIKGAAYQIKPELFSVVFFTAALFIYFYGRQRNSRIFLIYPLLFLLWVNSHGVFILGFLLLLTALSGEVLIYMLKSKEAMTKTGIAHYSAAVFLSLMTSLINPYGIGYPAYLYQYLASSDFLEYARHVQAALGTLKISQDIQMISSVIAAMALYVITSLYIYFKKGMTHAPLIFLNVVFGAMFFGAARTAFLYPLVWGFSMLYLFQWVSLKDSIKRIVTAAGAALFLIVSVSLLYANSSNRVWFGLDTADVYTPEAEVDFLRRHNLLRHQLFTEYYIGGYLIWALYPDAKVFIDPRGGPYIKGIFKEYSALFLGMPAYDDSGKRSFSEKEVILKEKLFNEFVSRHQFKVAAVALSAEPVVYQFLFSGDWKLIYFYNNAAIFAHISLDASHIREDLGVARFKRLKGENLPIFFNLYLNSGDTQSATDLINMLRQKMPNHPSLGDFERMIKDKVKRTIS
ncbi:MAG: hypothetical protein L0Y62_01455 [Nitrospirae bacterium]|nr:hypothetical protein [Nitrospirota bacterium]